MFSLSLSLFVLYMPALPERATASGFLKPDWHFHTVGRVWGASAKFGRCCAVNLPAVLFSQRSHEAQLCSVKAFEANPLCKVDDSETMG